MSTAVGFFDEALTPLGWVGSDADVKGIFDVAGIDGGEPIRVQYVGGMAGGRAGATSTLSVNFALTGGLGATVPAAGDYVVIQVTVGSAARNPSCAISTPAGYATTTQLNEPAQSFDTSMAVNTKFMTSTPDTAFTLPSTGNVADGQSYTVQVFRGVHKTTTLDVTSTSATGTGTTLGNPAAITPTTSGALVVVCVAGAGAATSALTFDAKLLDVRSSANADTNSSVATCGYFHNWETGAFDEAAALTGDATSTSSWCAYTLALRPAPKLSTLQEDFASGPDAKWNAIVNSNANVVGSFTGGVFIADFSGGTGATCNSLLMSADRYNMIGNSIFGKIKMPRTHDDINRMAWEFGLAAGTNAAFGDALYAYVTPDGNWIVAKRVAFTPTDLSVYDTANFGTTHTWWRFREWLGTAYFDTAPLAASDPPIEADWVNRYSVAVSALALNLSDIQFAAYAQVYTADSVPLTVSPTLDGLNKATSSGINATFAATEDTVDVFAAISTVLVSATFAATEATADTLAATAQVVITATFAATETTIDVLASTVKVIVSATLAVTEDATADVFAAVADTAIDVTFSVTESTTDTFSAIGDTAIDAVVAATETAVDTFASTAQVIVTAAVGAVETSTDTFASTAQVYIALTATIVESATDVLAATVQVVIAAAFAAVETGVDVFASSSQVIVTATAALVESTVDTFAATSALKIAAVFAAVEDTIDVFAAVVGFPAANVTFQIVESASDTLSATVSNFVSATLAATESVVDTIAATAQVIVTVNGTVTETSNDSFTASGTLQVSTTIAIVESAADIFDAIVYGVPPKQYPLAGVLQGYPGVAQTYPLHGINQDYPL